MIVERAAVEDAANIVALQKLAYRREAVIYQDSTIPPLTQTVEELQADFANHVFLKASIDGRIIGPVRARLRQDMCCIGRLMAHPEFRAGGIGTKLMYEIEHCFSTATRFELFTGHRSERNLRLHQRLGYRKFKSESVNENLALVYMEKQVAPEEA